MCIVERREVAVTPACVYGQYETHGLNYRPFFDNVAVEDDDHLLVIEGRFDRNRDRELREDWLNRPSFRGCGGNGGHRMGLRARLSCQKRRTWRKNGAFMATATDSDLEEEILQHFADTEHENRAAERYHEDMEAEWYSLMLDRS